MKHYVQGLELFEEAKVKQTIPLEKLTDHFQLSQIVSWNSRLYPHGFYDVDANIEHLLRREKFFQRIFLPASGTIDVPYSLHKIEVHIQSLWKAVVFYLWKCVFQLLNSRKEPFFSETAEAMADIIANTLKVSISLWAGGLVHDIIYLCLVHHR